MLLNVSKLDAFHETVTRLQAAAERNGSVLLLRGQTRRYSEPGTAEDCLRPALCRQGAAAGGEAEKQRFVDAFGQYLLAEAARGAALPAYWCMPVRVMRGGGGISIVDVAAFEKIPETWIAVLQHYEVPTEMLDVTLEADVALAFALWPFKYPPAPPTRTGVVYAFELPARTEGRRQHIELKPLFPWDENLRPVRQDGSLLCALYDEPQLQAKRPNYYASQLAATLRDQFRARNPQLTEEWLLPSNSEDRLYRFLLDEQERTEGARTFTISGRKGNKPGLPLFERLPVIEPLTGDTEVGAHGEVLHTRRYTEAATEAFLVMNLYAGNSPAILRAQENIARILGAIGKKRRLERILADNLEGGDLRGPLRPLDGAALRWHSLFGAHLPADVPLQGIDDRRRAQAQTEELRGVAPLGPQRTRLLEALRRNLLALGLRIYPLDVWALDQVATTFFLTQQIGDGKRWEWFVRALATAAKDQGIGLEAYPVFAFFAALYSLARGPSTTALPPPATATAGPSRPWLASVVGNAARTPDGVVELAEPLLRVLAQVAIDRAFFESAFAGSRPINLAKLQLYLQQHHGLTLVEEARDLLGELRRAAGGDLGQVDSILRALTELYELRLGFGEYQRIRSDWKRYSLRYVHARAPELFSVAPGWRERRRFDRERDQLFRLWRVVVDRYQRAAERAAQALQSRKGSYAIVINGAYRRLFEAMLERERISYSTIKPCL